MNFSESSRILSHLSPLLILLEVLVDIQSPGPEQFFSSQLQGICTSTWPCSVLAPVMTMGLIMGHMGMLELDGPGYNDLTATSLESWLVRELIPKWP